MEQVCFENRKETSEMTKTGHQSPGSPAGRTESADIPLKDRAGQDIMGCGGKRMCGRYYIDPEEENPDLERIISQLNRTGHENARLEGEIFPGDTSPVLSRNLRGEPRAFWMEWGFPLPKGRVINARTESAGTRPLFRDSLRYRRCIVPASGYFEWGPPVREKRKTKYRIRSADGDPLLLLAGLYRKEENGGQFVILTRDAGEDTRPIHPRMPLILPRNRAEEWLLSPAEGEDLLRSLLKGAAALRPSPDGDAGGGQPPRVDQVASAYQ